MAPRWLCVLGALAAGAGVMLILVLLIVSSEDRPLWGIDHGLLTAVAGVIATTAGMAAYAGMASRSPNSPNSPNSPKSLSLGAGLGAAGFGLILLATMSVVGGLTTGGASYEGWQATTGFDDPWNATTARQALESQGFNVTSERPDGLIATGADGIGVRIYVHDDIDPNASQQTFLLSVTFHADGGRVDDYEAAEQQADADRPAVDERFQDILAGFEASTGWDHMREPSWEARISVA